MHKKRFIVFLLIFFINMFFCENIYAEVKNIKYGSGLGVAKITHDPDLVKKINGKINSVGDKLVSEEIVRSFFPRRSESFWILSDIVKSKDQSLKKRITAARLLGAFRVNHDVNVLVNHLLLGYEDPIEFAELNKSNFPVGFALINIGIPARLHLLNRIKLTHNEELIRLCAFVLMKIEDTDIAKVILEREIKKEKHANQKDRLEKALSYLN